MRPDDALEALHQHLPENPLLLFSSPSNALQRKSGTSVERKGAWKRRKVSEIEAAKLRNFESKLLTYLIFSGVNQAQNAAEKERRLAEKRQAGFTVFDTIRPAP